MASMILSTKRQVLVTVFFALVACVDIRTARCLELDSLTSEGSNENQYDQDKNQNRRLELERRPLGGDTSTQARVSIGRPSFLHQSSPAVTPGAGGGSLSYVDTEYGANGAPTLYPTTPIANPYPGVSIFEGRPGEGTPAPRPTVPYTSPPVPFPTFSVPVDRPIAYLADRSEAPSPEPSATPSLNPTPNPTSMPTKRPSTPRPTTKSPTRSPTAKPTVTPKPSARPTNNPTPRPTTPQPTAYFDQVRRPGYSSSLNSGFTRLTASPSSPPTPSPTNFPSKKPTNSPTDSPIESEEYVESEDEIEVPAEIPTVRPVASDPINAPEAYDVYEYPTFAPTTWLPTNTFQPTILYPWLRPENHFHPTQPEDGSEESEDPVVRRQIRGRRRTSTQDELE